MYEYLLLRIAYNLLYSETLETSSYMIGGAESPAVQGFLISINCLAGSWRVCEPGMNP